MRRVGFMILGIIFVISVGLNVYFSLPWIKNWRVKEEKKKEKGELMLKVGETEVYISDFKGFLDSLPEINKIELNRNPTALTRTVVDFIESLVVVELARAQGYFERPDVKIRLIVNTANILRPYIFSSEIRPYLKVDFSELQSFYEQNKEAFKHPPVVRLMRIFSQDKNELIGIRKEIKDLKSFIEVAQRRHLPAEFDFGYVSYENLSPELADIIFSMKAGEISQPIKYLDSWSIFAIVDKLDEGYWDFEKVIDKVMKAVREKKIRDRISQITKEFLLNHGLYINFDGISNNLGVTLSREKFEELLMQKYIQ